MSELFELIMSYPMEFIAGLGVSSATIYSVIKIIKCIVSFMFKNRNKLKEISRQNEIACAVVNKLNLDEIVKMLNKEFSETIANLKTEIEELKKILTALAEKSDCPVELKAYIETVLRQDGNEQLALFYEQIKSSLIEQIKYIPKTEIKVEENTLTKVEEPKQEEQVIEQNTEESKQNIFESEQIIQESKQNKKQKKAKKKVQEDEDISYA